MIGSRKLYYESISLQFIFIKKTVNKLFMIDDVALGLRVFACCQVPIKNKAEGDIR